jgi:uncharacterized protein YoxC
MQQVEVANVPVVALWIIAGAQIVFALAVAVIAFVLISLMKSTLGEVKEILADVKAMERELKGRMPRHCENVDGMVNDVAGTTHKGTAVVNQVLNVVGAVVGRLESPLVKSAGVLAGLAAGLRAVRGANNREREVIIERDSKRRGSLGRKK